MRLAALIHRDPDEAWVSAHDAIAMATELGAHALGVPGLGVLEPGAPADVALLDRRGVGLGGARELEAALVWSESGPGVRHTIVAGEVVVRDGQLTRIDLDEIQGQIAEQCARRARSGPQSPVLVATIARLQDTRRRLAEQQGRPARRAVNRRVVFLLALVAGISVANLYYAQPLLHLIGDSLGTSPETAGLLVAGSQLGYAVGLLFLVPLGDLVERRG